MARRTHKGAPQLRAHKPSAHLFRNHGRAFLFDPCTRTSFALDTSGEVAAREMLGGKPARRGVTAEKVASARDELTALYLRGYFRSDAPVPSPPPGPRNHLLMVNLSLRCNLRCRYCYVGHAARDGSPDAPQPLDMSPSVMKATVQFIGDAWEASSLAAPYFGVACSGEVACQFDLYDRFKDLLEAESARRGVEFLASAWSATNGTLLSDPASLDRVIELQCGYVSLDGPPEAHDAVRVYPDGRGTYDDVMRALALGRGPRKAGAILTGAYPDVASVYRHLLGLGFEVVCVKPVRAKPNAPYHIARDLEGICDGYTRLADWLLSLPDEELTDCLRRITSVSESEDYFGRFFDRVKGKHLLLCRCLGGNRDLVVDTDGQLYVCSGLAGAPAARLGSVWEGFDETRIQELAEQLQVTRRIPCKDCWARFLCGGGCMHQSYLTFGDLFRPDPAECALNQHLIELAIWFYAELKEKRPTVLEHLQRPPVATA